MRLQNKAAIVTGSATGIGQAIACGYAREGAAVTIDYVGGGKDSAQAMVAQIERDGGRAIAVEADVSQQDQVRNLVAQTVQAFGRLDIMVNNAGIEKDMPFVDTPLEVWNKIIAVDLTGAFLCSQEAAKQMIKQGGPGRIINISSVHEDLPKPGGVPYCAAKGGMRMMMRTMCLELAPQGITVNDIGPGAIDTPLDAPLKANPELYKELLDEIPLHRMGQPDEVAEMAIYLASDASSYVTGSTFFIDGGLMRYTKGL
jgi:glucose 1-dehydrogenase